MKKLLYAASLVCLSCFACSSKEKTEKQLTKFEADAATATQAISGASAFDVVPSDTLVMDTKHVVFFVLSQAEVDALVIASGEEASAVKKAYADFFYHAGQTCTQLTAAGIKAEISTDRVFKCIARDSVYYYNRMEHADAEVGVLVFNGEAAPQIATDAALDIDLITLMEGN